MLSWLCAASFGVLFCVVVLGWRYIYLELLDRVVRSSSFLTARVCKCDLAHRRSVAVLCMVYILQDLMLPDAPSLWCSTCSVCAASGYKRYCDRFRHIGTLMSILAAEPRSTAGLLFPCQYLCGTILVTPCSMVLDVRVLGVKPMPVSWPSC